jgi:hypothetical protein
MVVIEFMKSKLAFLSLIVLLAMCSREIDCFKADLHFGLIGFSDTESDTIILKRFTKNANNPVMVDSFPLSPIRYQRNQDTLNMVAYPGELDLDMDYNYELSFPGTTKVIRITDITEEQLHMKKNGDVGCGNRVTSYKLDGQVITNIPSFNMTYFTR